MLISIAYAIGLSALNAIILIITGLGPMLTRSLFTASCAIVGLPNSKRNPATVPPRQRSPVAVRLPESF